MRVFFYKKLESTLLGRLKIFGIVFTNCIVYRANKKGAVV